MRKDQHPLKHMEWGCGPPKLLEWVQLDRLQGQGVRGAGIPGAGEAALTSLLSFPLGVGGLKPGRWLWAKGRTLSLENSHGNPFEKRGLRVAGGRGL